MQPGAPRRLPAPRPRRPGNRGVVHHRCIFARRAGVAITDRLALGLIRLEQLGASPPLRSCRKLPGQVGAVVDAGIHAEAAGRREQMRGIARDHDAPGLVAFSDQRLTGIPGLVADDVHRYVRADRVLHPAATSSLSTSRRPPFGFDQHHEFIRPLSAMMTPRVWGSGLTAQYIQARRWPTNFG